jgi:collagenase-like PrtC family protease
MATLVLQIPDESLVQKVKQACKMIVGVASVKVQKTATKKEYDITKTAGYREAMDDVKNGRVTTYDSLQDFYKEMGL